MNEMQIFKNEKFKDMDFSEQLQRFGLMAAYLAMAAELADKGLKKSAERILHFACNECSGYISESDLFLSLFDAVRHYIYGYCFDRDNEYTYHHLFNKYAPKIIHNCRVIERKGDYHNQPDSWIELNGEEVPVEIKLGNFDKKALKQLQRYINAFNAKNGVAVGRTLTVELPDNIIFVSNNELDFYDIDKYIKISDDDDFLYTFEEALQRLKDETKNKKTSDGGKDDEAYGK